MQVLWFDNPEAQSEIMSGDPDLALTKLCRGRPLFSYRFDPVHRRFSPSSSSHSPFAPLQEGQLVLHFDFRMEELDGEGALAVLLDHDLRSEEHTSELQSRGHLVCRLLLDKKT